MIYFNDKSTTPQIALIPITSAGLVDWLSAQGQSIQNSLNSIGFKAASGELAFVHGTEGNLEKVVFGVKAKPDFWAFASLPQLLPEGSYQLNDATLSNWTEDDFNKSCISWALGHYNDQRFKSKIEQKKECILIWPSKADKGYVAAAVRGTVLARDLINSPTNKLGPHDLARSAKKLAKEFGSEVQVIVGKNLLKRGFPAIHVVGQATDEKKRAPRLVDFSWGDSGPKITLVGKGVCFDTGGLNLKPGAGMATMKKDMGGAAQVLGLASMIMATDLQVQLRVLVPAVENSVNGNSYRPQDVIDTRKGLTVEIGNTDAEGRLILADALTEASSSKPDLIIDCATLTGAARVALGTDLPAMFSNDDGIAMRLQNLSEKVEDPVWRMPLHQPYKSSLHSPVADLNNISGGPYAGAITAALFLEHFVDGDVPWIHLDLMAWNLKSTPGRPVGGEAMGIRALYALIKEMVE